MISTPDLEMNERRSLSSLLIAIRTSEKMRLWGLSPLPMPLGSAFAILPFGLLHDSCYLSPNLQCQWSSIHHWFWPSVAIPWESCIPSISSLLEMDHNSNGFYFLVLKLSTWPLLTTAQSTT